MLDAQAEVVNVCRPLSLRLVHQSVGTGEQFVSELAGNIPAFAHGSSRAYGELVDVLWQRGLKRAAIELESFWSNVIRAQHLALLCGYAMPAFYQELDALEEVCRRHTDVRMSIRLVSPTG